MIVNNVKILKEHAKKLIGYKHQNISILLNMFESPGGRRK